MNILITAGGTAEKIDAVRKITNDATGRLGCRIAEAFRRQADASDPEIFYVHGVRAACPDFPGLHKIPIGDTDELSFTLESLLRQRRFDAVIHTMAVSDYAVKSVTTAALLAEEIARALEKEDVPRGETLLAARIERLIRDNPLQIKDGNKIRSDHENLLLSLRRTPKVIGIFRQLQPSAVLVGFKLLDGVTEETLLAAGRKILRENRCDFVLANDSQSFQNGGHTGYLIEESGSAVKLEGREEIAGRIAEKVLRKIGDKGDGNE